MIEHPEDADRYARAKADAAAAVADGSSAYNSAKTEVIQEIVDRARAAQGLPRVAVSDK
ncbi:GrpB family protein [uncultured Microbacterium sp.]|uniref:GrpB family protein n=1 Tax=uncultured Microbacterium sp. TaxID=191216 RepID=UPI0037DDCC9E